MSNENPKISAFENSLRYKTLMADSTNQPMTLSERMAYYKVPGVSIAVINDGQLEWAKGYGFVTDAITDSKKIDTETLFQAASISKAINAMGALLLVQNRQILLDEDINLYLKSWKIPENNFSQKEKVTLRRLLSHSAGISLHGFPGFTTDEPIPSTLELLESRKPAIETDLFRVIQEPGAAFQYSGGGTTIVQLLIEDITGEKYDAWMQRNILMPLHMTRSTFAQPLTQEAASNAANGHQSDGTRISGGWHVYPYMAAGGLWTTPTDLAYFIVELLKMLNHQPGILQSALIKEAITPQITIEQWYSDTISEASGLGFFLAGSGEDLSFAHDGGNAGFISRFIALPEHRKGFVIMVNNDGAFSLIDEITHSIADVYGIPGFKPIERPEMMMTDMTQYSGFVGTYQHKDDELTISTHDNKLFLSFWYSQEMQLHREHNDLFFIQEYSDTVRLIKLGDNTYQVNVINNEETVYKKIISSQI